VAARFAEKSQFGCQMLGGSALDMKWAQYRMQAIFNYKYDEDINWIVSWLMGLPKNHNMHFR
jgi:hypothetical protein